MPREGWGIEKITVKVPYLVDIVLKNRTVKAVAVHIFSKSSGKCIDVQNYSKNDGGSIVQYAVHGGDNQKWRLLIAEPL